MRIPSSRPAATTVRRVVITLLAVVAVTLGPVGAATACIKPPISWGHPHVPIVVRPPYRPHVPSTPPCATPPTCATPPSCATPPWGRPPCATPPVTTPPESATPPAASTPPARTPRAPRTPARCADGTTPGSRGCETVTTPPSFTG